ncbi:restriction endonuclease subunit S [Psychromicrobium lacuslunae]|uniref:Type I restriction modification DNA specificity domain-containing protein n=1 Tax=Psychromicrobium lacuslunae TaxID=1618207 RepID=A0A0D4BXU7_9MICC|nr:restriction endonuclease subunit S [Psychromicrobium lacuslunae]AJT41124.1 hypothetical protein UM93_05595 [Psychromicrobium lacuslunae]
MSRIDKLIAELCPDGVRYVEVAQLFNLRNGYTPSKSNASFWSDGNVPWFRMEDIRANGGVLDHALQRVPGVAVKGGKLFPANSLLVATSATIGEHALVTVPHLSNQRFTSLSIKSDYADQIDMKFMYYYGFVLDEWCRNNTTTSSFASVDMTGFKRFRFPVPPLEVQREVVRILDQFTQLEAELEAELEARRRQYEHYRNDLLMGDGVKRHQARLDELFDLRAGKFITASEIVPLPDSRHTVPCFGGGGLRGYVASPNQRGDLVVIGRQGALCGNVKRADGEFYATEHAVVVTPRDGVDIRWAFHLLTSMNLNQYASKSAQPGLAVGTLNQLVVDVPRANEQLCIGSVLDKFDALVNDLSVGLPAELAARRKQYEYYRDKLLAFKEAV